MSKTHKHLQLDQRTAITSSKPTRQPCTQAKSCNHQEIKLKPLLQGPISITCFWQLQFL